MNSSSLQPLGNGIQGNGFPTTEAQANTPKRNYTVDKDKRILKLTGRNRILTQSLRRLKTKAENKPESVTDVIQRMFGSHSILNALLQCCQRRSSGKNLEFNDTERTIAFQIYYSVGFGSYRFLRNTLG